jgi:hypothetical protein
MTLPCRRQNSNRRFTDILDLVTVAGMLARVSSIYYNRWLDAKIDRTRILPHRRQVEACRWCNPRTGDRQASESSSQISIILSFHLLY